MTQFRPMRFLHAAGLMLERPLLETGELAGDLAKTAAHATLFAWERLVDLAIAKDVDFVLLTGETFDFREASLAAEVAFRQGAQRLDAKEIPLIIAPGQLDSASGWAAIPALPENVTLFEHAEDPAIDLTVGGQTYCAIVPITDSTSVDPPELERLRARVPKRPGQSFCRRGCLSSSPQPEYGGSRGHACGSSICVGSLSRAWWPPVARVVADHRRARALPAITGSVSSA